MEDSMKKCPFCGEEILLAAKKCKYCKEWLDDSVSSNIFSNELKRFNWGVLFTGWIWGLCNGMPKGALIALILTTLLPVFVPILLAIPLAAICIESKGDMDVVLGFLVLVNLLLNFIPFGVAIWAGTQGNRWAWNNKNWKSVEEFNDCQRKWVWIPLVVYALMFIFMMLSLLIEAALGELSQTT